MKNLFFVFGILFFLSFNSTAQNTPKQLNIGSKSNVEQPFTSKEKAFIIEAYSEVYFNSLSTKPGLLYRFKDILRNRVRFHKVESQEKLMTFPLLSSISLFKAYNPNIKPHLVFNKESFNVLKYDFNFDSNQTYRIHIDNTNYILSIHSQFSN